MITIYPSYIYRPFSDQGSITGLDAYCSDGRTHSPCRKSHGFDKPVDIFYGVNPSPIYLRVTNCHS
jgi:hypothetical protein